MAAAYAALLNGGTYYKPSMLVGLSLVAQPGLVERNSCNESNNCLHDDRYDEEDSSLVCCRVQMLPFRESTKLVRQVHQTMLISEIGKLTKNTYSNIVTPDELFVATLLNMP